MITHTITSLHPEWSPAYVANGFVGLRIGQFPLTGGTALVNGYFGLSALEKVESIAPAPYPVAADLRLNHLWLSERPDLAAFREQRYDFATGELTSRFDFRVNGITAKVEVVTFCSRSMPTLTVQEVRVEVDQACDLTLRARLDPAGIPGRCLHRDSVNLAWRVADGCLHWEAAGGIGSIGAAYTTDLVGADEALPPKKNFWGHTNALTSDYAIAAKPGRSYALRQIGSLVPSLMHHEPDRQAIRMIGLGRTRGFDELRRDNRAAWAELWRGRVKLVGAGERWQTIADACFFYVHSTIHPSSPCSLAAWGLAREGTYLGHVFWDCETFCFPPVLLTEPHAARAMMDYRSRTLAGARRNAALNGYRGVQFPWQSGTTGVEELASWALAIFTEQHISLDVAFAFAQFAHATGDEVFIKQQAWPVLEGVAEWISSRVTATARGYEIRHITGIDEGIENIDNNAATNLAAVVVLREAIALAERLGFSPPPRWRDIERRMHYPVDPATNVVIKHDGYEYKGGCCCPEPLAAFFPYTFRASPEVERATWKYYLNLAPTFTHLPMLTSQTGVFAARLGDRQAAADLFKAGIGDFMVEPYAQFIEWIERSVNGDQAVPATPYLANMGGFLMACLYGLTGIQLDAGDPAGWAKFPVVLPAGWDAIEVDRIWVRGRPARLVAKHGDQRATITMLD